jgi:hypothetical protein
VRADLSGNRVYQDLPGSSKTIRPFFETKALVDAAAFRELLCMSGRGSIEGVHFDRPSWLGNASRSCVRQLVRGGLGQQGAQISGFENP